MSWLRSPRPRYGATDYELARDLDVASLGPLGRGYREHFFHVLRSRRRRAITYGALDVVLAFVVLACAALGFAGLVVGTLRHDATGRQWLVLLVWAVVAFALKRRIKPRVTFRFHRDVADELAKEARHLLDRDGAYAGLEDTKIWATFATRVEDLSDRTRQEWRPDDSPESVGRLRYQLQRDIPLLPHRLYFYLKAMFYALAGGDNEWSSQEPVFPPVRDSDGTVKQINRRAGEIVHERTGLRLWRTIIIVSSGFIPIVALVFVPTRVDGDIVGEHLTFGIFLAFAEAFCLIILMFVRRRVGLLGAQLQLLEYDIVIASLVEDHEKTAANLFFKHQTELKQYYDQTLRQNRQSFVLGVMLVLIGLGSIVGVIALLLANNDSPTSSRIAAGALGGVSAVLTGFVARVYLRVYEGSATSLGNFHGRLVNTNNFHFANLLVSGVAPDRKRTDALAELATTVAHRAAVEAASED